MTRPDPHRPEVRLVVTGRQRARSRVAPVAWPDAPDPAVDALVERIAEVPEAWGWTLSGGEPTLRADLPVLVRELIGAGASRLGIATDGLALSDPRVAQSLVDWGVTRVRIGMHSARGDANDWLVGTSGATRRVRKAIEACAARGLLVEIETVVTRPMLPLIEEIVLLTSALGARAIHFRRPFLGGPNAVESVTLSPRLGLLQPFLEGAAQAAWRRGMRVALHGFPLCAAPSKARFLVRPGAERWLLPADWEVDRSGLEPPRVSGCPTCPEDCDGAPADYVDRFGRTEFDSQARAGEPPEPHEDGVPVPPPRAGWAPATRVADARLRASVGRPAGAPGEPVEVLRLRLDPGASTRVARQELVRAAQQRPRVLRLVGGWATHDKAAGLLAETRYFDAEVELVGEVDRLAALSDRALTRLGRLARVDAVIRGPDAARHDARVGRSEAFESTLALVDRLSAAGVAVRVCADAVEPSDRPAFIEAWSQGTLPGEPLWLDAEDR